MLALTTLFTTIPANLQISTFTTPSLPTTVVNLAGKNKNEHEDEEEEDVIEFQTFLLSGKLPPTKPAKKQKSKKSNVRNISIIKTTTTTTTTTPSPTPITPTKVTPTLTPTQLAAQNAQLTQTVVRVSRENGILHQRLLLLETKLSEQQKSSRSSNLSTHINWVKDQEKRAYRQEQLKLDQWKNGLEKRTLEEVAPSLSPTSTLQQVSLLLRPLIDVLAPDTESDLNFKSKSKSKSNSNSNSNSNIKTQISRGANYDPYYSEEEGE